MVYKLLDELNRATVESKWLRCPAVQLHAVIGEAGTRSPNGIFLEIIIHFCNVTTLGILARE
jgi:hypothetical protein